MIKAQTEIRNLQYLMDKSEGVLFTRCIVKLLDTFVLVGPNGIHQCLVLELVGPSFESVQQSYTDFNNYAHHIGFGNAEFNNSTQYSEIECSRIFEITKRLFMALRFVHGLEMCHGGINGANIAFTFRNSLRHATEEDVFGVMGSPQVVPLERCDGMPLSKGLPKEIVQSAQWTGYVDEDESDIRLIGFGKSFLRGEEPDKLKQPEHLRCPEVIMGDKLDCRLDLWHTGCFIYQLLMYEPPFPGSSDDYEHIMNIVGFVDDLPVEWESKVEDLRVISKQNRVLENVCNTDKKTCELQATEATLPESLAQTEEKLAAEGSLAKDDNSSEGQHTGPSSQTRELAKLASASRLKEIFAKRANNPMLAPLLTIMEGFLRFRPSDRLPLLAATELAESASFPTLDKCPLQGDAPEGKQELTVSDAVAHLELTGVQADPEQARPDALEGAIGLSKNHEQRQQPVQREITNSLEERGPQPQERLDMPRSPRQVQLEAAAETPEPLVIHEPHQEQELEGCQSTEKTELETKTGTLGPPSDHHDHQPFLPEHSRNLEQDQLGVVDGALDLFPDQGKQQPDILDGCQSVDKSQSDAQTGTGTSDLQSDHDGPQPTLSENPNNLGPNRLEIVVGASDLLDNQGGHQPEMSEIPESSNQSQLKQAEDSGVSSDDGGEQKSRSRKRLRSRIGGLLNHSWTPWKRRRKS
ncbi:uncharacterized protein N7500_005818 [Penicillium coprophilum]|uniref:uncharacterized protein n=1 Tax=Penicillium coprophilum TaxID=36646 RepID=UPI00238B01CE|nr:uncharacterized protein N7500_005818 [Penicillium coprophilum]KAJ5163988.1 hypothetical protein N7500_005818 [Penicillium coprophilum]